MKKGAWHQLILDPALLAVLAVSRLLSWYQHNLPLIVYDCNQFSENGEVCWHSICALTAVDRLLSFIFLLFSLLPLPEFLPSTHFLLWSFIFKDLYIHTSKYIYESAYGSLSKIHFGAGLSQGHLLAAGICNGRFPECRRRWHVLVDVLAGATDDESFSSSPLSSSSSSHCQACSIYDVVAWCNSRSCMCQLYALQIYALPLPSFWQHDHQYGLQWIIFSPNPQHVPVLEWTSCQLLQEENLPPANTSTLSDLIPRSSSYGAVLQIGNRHATPVLMLSSPIAYYGSMWGHSSALSCYTETGRFHIELDASIMHSLLRNSHTIRLSKSCGAQGRLKFILYNGLLS